MIATLIEWSLRNRFAVILLAGVAAALGARAASRLPVDAFPDTTPTQVQINTYAPELGAEEIERLVTFPIESRLGGLAGLRDVRSLSRFGLSQVVALFDDGADPFAARLQVAERLAEVELPEGVGRPTLGPPATGLGEVVHYLVSGGGLDGVELRSLHDWTIAPRLRRVPGVAEVNAWGGLERQIQIRIDPDRLAARGLTLEEVASGLRGNNRNAGGGAVERNGEAAVVVGAGRARSAADLDRMVVASRDGVPIRVSDIGRAEEGWSPPRGSATAGGGGEVVLGLAFARVGANPREVSRGVEEAIGELARELPPGVSVEIALSRSRLVDQVLATARRNLTEGAALVVAVLFGFLGSWRAGLIVASSIPLSMLFAASMMERAAIAGSLMSLGAIDFGLIVDSSVVMVENCSRRLAEEPEGSGRSRLEIVRDAAAEVRRPAMFGELIIMIVYLPILMLEGVEGKLFRPMALTVVFALGASLVLSMTLIPALASLGLARRPRRERTWLDRGARAAFGPLLRAGLRAPRTTLLLVGALTAGGLALGTRLGSEFIPRLDEGALAINTVRLAGVGLGESTHYGSHIERVLLEEFPDELDRVWTRTGSAAVATDPMGFEVSDVFATLKPREGWKRARDGEELASAVSEALAEMPGMRAVVSQPIAMRLNEMDAGVRGDVGAKLFGDDLEVLKAKSREIEGVLRRVRGAADVSVEQATGQPTLTLELDFEALARRGLSAGAALDHVRALDGLPVGEIRESDRRIPLAIRLPESIREEPERLLDVVLATPDGGRAVLGDLGRLVEAEGPSAIRREWGQRRLITQANVRGRDLGSFVEEARARVEAEVELPPGYRVEWGGQYEHMIRAERRLMWVVPTALGLILCLLYLTFHSLRDAAMIFSGVLFARVGGVFGLWLAGLPFTISAGVGFVALAGASMLEGLVLVAAIRDRLARGMPKREAIEDARLARLRPVLMTGSVAAIGFVPMALSDGVGAEVQRPLAIVIVFGMAFDTFLTLLALPALYLLFGKGPEGTEGDGDGGGGGTGSAKPSGTVGEFAVGNGVSGVGDSAEGAGAGTAGAVRDSGSGSGSG